jgi:hypothetical protein
MVAMKILGKISGERLDMWVEKKILWVMRQ